MGIWCVSTHMEDISVKVPPPLLEKVDEHEEREGYDNQSQAVRDLLRKGYDNP